MNSRWPTSTLFARYQVFACSKEWKSSLTQFLDDGGHSHNVNLQVDASSKRLTQRSSQPLACIRGGLLKHDLRTVQVEVSEPVFWALVNHFKSQAGHPKGQAAFQVRDH